MRFTVPAIYAGSVGFLENLLEENPKASIIHVLTHEKRPGFFPIEEENGELYVDEFGMNVYIGKEVDWNGGLTDLDERFDERRLPF